MMTMRVFSLLSLVLFIPPTIPFYIPGVAPRNFQKGEDVEVKVIDSLIDHWIYAFVSFLFAGCENDKYEDAITL